MVGNRTGRARSGSWPSPEIDDAGLAWHVGEAMLRRARSIVVDGGVLTCRLVAPGALAATVAGTRPWPYEVSVSFTVTGGRVDVFEGDCDCPVELDCKHAAAALLFHLGGVAPPAPGRLMTVVDDSPAWEASLTQLLGASLRPPGERDRALTQLAIQIGVVSRPSVGDFGTAGLRMRPIQFNARNRWVSSGVSWRDLRYGYFTAHYRPEQLESLRGIADLEQHRRPNQVLTSWITMDGPGAAQLWDALADAHQMGVDLLLDGSHAPIDLASEPAEVALDVVREETLRLRPVVRLDGRNLDAATTRLVGEPVTGVILDLSTDHRGDRSITLARLRRPPTSDLARMLHAGSIPIPAGDESRFLAEFLPNLRRRLPVLCSDESAALPEPAAPQLALTVTREPGHRIVLHWQWQEESGRRRELDDRRGLAAFERKTMRATVDAVLALDVLPSPALGSGPDGVEPIPRYPLQGLQSVDFMNRAWPVLSGRPDLITELDGPDAHLSYRPASGPLELDIAGDPEDCGDDSGFDEDRSTRDWFGLAVRVSVDGEQVPFELVFRALAGADPVVILPSGTYLDLTGDAQRWTRLRELIDESRAMDDAGPDELRINRYTASRWSDLEDSGLLGERAARWSARLRALAVGSGPPSASGSPAVPAGLHADLRGYQREGLDWLRERYDRGLGGVLADDMGLGKTVQMLGLIAHARRRDPGGPPLLVVAPTSVVANWLAEAAHFTPDLRVLPVTQGQARRGRRLADAVPGVDLVVTSYQLFRMANDEFRELPWAALILDEAQFVKSVQSKGFRCARDFPAPVTFAVTGTPLENNLMEFWALLAIATPGLFPDSRRFTEHYRVPIERGGAVNRLDQLRRRAAPFVLRRTKEQVAPELPAKLEQVIELDLSPRHQQVYQRHLQRERQKILGLLDDDRSLDDHRFQILRSLTLLRQLSLDPSLIDEAYRDIPSSKLDVAIDRIEEIAGSGHRVLVFSQFTRFLDRTRDRLARLGVPHCRLDGRTNNRAAVIEEFRSGTAPVFLISLKAGGFGLNLTEADYCILLDPWWNPAAENQAIDRTHRIGQTRTVIVHRYVARGTIEEKVMALKAGKAKLFDDVLGASAAGRPVGGSLTAEEIRDLLA